MAIATAFAITARYRLAPGRQVASFAIHCAAKANIDVRILQRTVDVTAALAAHVPVPPLASLRTGVSDTDLAIVSKVSRPQRCVLDLDDTAPPFSTRICGQP